MIASGQMKQSIIGQAGGEDYYIDDSEPTAFGGKKSVGAIRVDPEVAEVRMMGMVERMEKWNLQKQHSKYSGFDADVLIEITFYRTGLIATES